jgi:mRNA-degrading endonuclease RelE of RelBE toxin-antitoxin system
MMNIYYTELFREKVKALPAETRKALKTKLELMVENPRHPSLRTKKIHGQEGIFEASVTMAIHITWQYTNDGVLLRNIGEHDKTLKNP